MQKRILPSKRYRVSLTFFENIQEADQLLKKFCKRDHHVLLEFMKANSAHGNSKIKQLLVRVYLVYVDHHREKIQTILL